MGVLLIHCNAPLPKRIAGRMGLLLVHFAILEPITVVDNAVALFYCLELFALVANIPRCCVTLGAGTSGQMVNPDPRPDRQIVWKLLLT